MKSLIALGALCISLVNCLPSGIAPTADIPTYATALAARQASVPAPITPSNLATSFAPNPLPDAIAIESIRNTLALYAFAIDGKNFAALDRVFTKDAITKYPEPLNILSPLNNVVSGLQASLQCVTTQHTYGTQLIQVNGLTRATSVTYFRAAHFGSNKLKGSVAEAFGQYQDEWVRTADLSWRIKQRNFIYMGSLQGSMEVFTDC